MRSTSAVVTQSRLIPACLLILSVSPHAHEGHVHGPEPGAAQVNPQAMRGQRLEDGSVLLPKAAQFRLGIRTQLASPSEAGRSVTLSGTVIADPQRRGVVGVAEASLLEAPPEGFPRLGERVAAGRILAYARPVLTTLERARRRAASAGIEQQILINAEAQKLLRQQLRGKVAMASAGATLERLDIEQRALRVRQQQLQASLEARLALQAEQAGTISTAQARSGGLFKPGDVVFEIVDPERLWVDVARYAADPVDTHVPITAATARNVRLKLGWVGQDVRLREGVLNAHLQIISADGPLRIGETVNLSVESAKRGRGLRLPTSSAVWAAGGGERVWVQTQAERFVSRPVETLALDADHVLVTTGVQPGERVVVAGAWLLAQVQ